MLYKCKECGKEFKSLRSLHAHIKRHDLLLGDYYVKHYQRRNKLTDELLPFKNYKSYFAKDFNHPSELLEWCDISPKEIVKSYIIDILRRRITNKNLDHGPTNLDLITAGLPPVDVYKEYFGSYTEACQECGVKPLLYKKLPKQFHSDFSNVEILIDTREQKPLTFAYSKKQKLDFGDYGVQGDLYDYTFVDRKNFADFCSTVTIHYKRFAKELERCRDLGCYMFVVVDENFDNMENVNKKNYKKFKLDYVYHNMRELQNEYSECCQFVFSGSREYSSYLIPKLLILGRNLWEIDMQYFWSKLLYKYELEFRPAGI
tara:strand:- start:182 stop:1129 length:948 start_codon:yes stop_codon:yes gene_type:complete